MKTVLWRGLALVRGEHGARAVLMVVVATTLVAAFRLTTLRPVGVTRDDGEYLAYALALVAGMGYVDPASPELTPASRYPIGYPLLLAAVLELAPDPIFGALAVGPLALAVFLLGGFVLLRRQGGLGPWPALALTTLGALSPAACELAATTCSDLPFAALVVLALLVLDRPLREPRQAEPTRWLWGGILVAAAALVRTAGWALVAALVVTVWRRRCVGAAWPAFVPVVVMGGGWHLWDWQRGAAGYGGTFAATIPQDAPGWAARALASGSELLGRDLAAAVWPLTGWGALPGLGLVGLVVALATLAGALRWAWRPDDFAPGSELAPTFAVFTVALAAGWSLAFIQFYPGVQLRFLLPAAPVLAASAWGLARAGCRRAVAPALTPRLGAGFLVLAVAASAGAFAHHPVGQALGSGRAALLARKAEWDAWFSAIRSRTPEGSRVLSAHHVMVWLHTGRPGYSLPSAVTAEGQLRPLPPGDTARFLLTHPVQHVALCPSVGHGGNVTADSFNPLLKACPEAFSPVWLDPRGMFGLLRVEPPALADCGRGRR